MTPLMSPHLWFIQTQCETETESVALLEDNQYFTVCKTKWEPAMPQIVLLTQNLCDENTHNVRKWDFYSKCT